jgi:putative ABC transport system ATP-binding protein
MPDSMDALIEVTDLGKVYGEGRIAVHALRNIGITILRGEFVAIMGPSGSGKSTLMNVLGCLDRPTHGRYILDGEDVSTLDRDDLADIRNTKIGFVFQSFNLLPRLSALRNVMLPMIYIWDNKPTPEEREERAIAALEAVGLGDRLHHRPNELSGGQQQRVAIARALVNRPPLILADEPTGNLDTQSGEEIMTILHRLHDEGATVLMVTHESSLAHHADRILRLHDGVVHTNGDHSQDRPGGAV